MVDSPCSCSSQAKSQFKRRSTANNVEIHIPVPTDADSPKFKTTVGSVKWVPENSEIVWSIKSFPVSGKSWFTLSIIQVVTKYYGISAFKEITLEYHSDGYEILLTFQLWKENIICWFMCIMCVLMWLFWSLPIGWKGVFDEGPLWPAQCRSRG